MAPFHEIYLLELFECHVGVEELEFGGGAVFLEFGFPVCGGEWWEGAGYWFPFCDTEAVI